MPGTTDIPGPSFISSHSADVILSEVRPIKLKIEALRSINVLLDEFLYNILDTASSLSTDKLRASLLSLLPTTLGKEALLEAEVELRAYWGRTGPQDATVASPEDGAKTFHLQWVYKLLRLKCEAYSTLNESDEDPGAEERITTTMSSAGCSPPKTTLIAPAALYLTAIIEALCEHILSNVARVVARDSSRGHATLQDLFVALCEDQSIYNLFKNMKVYEEIEQLSKAPKARRSKSLTRSDRAHAGSPHSERPTVKDGSSARSRLSSEGNGSTTTIPIVNPRSSGEKTKAKNGHRRSESSVSELSGHNGVSPVNDEASMVFDDELRQEFDDLMRSSATMKVSLTPDRLKTMEVYKQEKDRRGNRRLASSPSTPSSDPSSASSRGTAHRPLVLLHVDSIQEDEEENATKTPPLVPQNRIRHGSLSSPEGPAQVGSAGRVRSMSVDPSILAQDPALATSQARLTPNKLIQKHRVHPGQDPRLARPRKSQSNVESMDLDDIMAGSDEDHVSLSTPKSKRVSTPSRTGKPSVSAGTRELMDFLAAGPPHTGPAPTSQGSVENGKSKGSGRLQRMISKLSLGNGDRSKSASDELSRSKSTSTRSTPPAKSSPGSVSPLANRPIPPRLPRPSSPDSPSGDASPETSHSSTRSHSESLSQTKPKSAETQLTEFPLPLPRETFPTSRQAGPVLNGQVRNDREEEVVSSPTALSRATYTADKAVSESLPPGEDFPIPHAQACITAQADNQACKPTSGCNINDPHISGDDARKLHGLLSHATTADECRLLLDMFLVKSGISSASPPTPVVPRAEVIPVDAIERSIVELLLDDL